MNTDKHRLFINHGIHGKTRKDYKNLGLNLYKCSFCKKMREGRKQVSARLGAREHNLKNVDVTLPRNKLVVISGLSGSTHPCDCSTSYDIGFRLVRNIK